MSDLYTCKCITSLRAAFCYLALVFFLILIHLYIWYIVWSDPPTHFEEVGPSRSAAGSVLRSPAHNWEFTDFILRDESKSSIDCNWDPQKHLMFVGFVYVTSETSVSKVTIVWSLSFSRPTLSSTLKKPLLFSFFTTLIRGNIFSSKSECVSQKNSSHNLLSPYIEGDLSLVPLEYYLIALSSIEVREPFIEKH